jgi:hypothetical protein
MLAKDKYPAPFAVAVAMDSKSPPRNDLVFWEADVPSTNISSSFSKFIFYTKFFSSS